MGVWETVLALLPVLAFLVFATVLAEAADAAGLFDAIAHWAMRTARGNTALLYLLVCVTASVTTILLSIDTTAVLLTPVVIAVVQACGLPPLPFVITVLYLANTASLLLPISNLTNLLAWDQLHPEPGLDWYVSRLALPALVAIVATCVLLYLRYRRSLPAAYEVPVEKPVAPDRVSLWSAAIACAALGPLVIAGVPAWIATACLSLPLLLIVVRRGLLSLSMALLPWRAVLIVGLLFGGVLALTETFGAGLFTAIAGTGTSGADLAQLTVAGAGLSNIINNIPATAALLPQTDDPVRVLAMLIGVNTAPLITVWASLATVLWRERCRARGVNVSARQLAGLGIWAVPAITGLTLLAFLGTQ